MRRFPLRHGGRDRFCTESIPPDPTGFYVRHRPRPQIHGWPLAHPVRGRRSNHPRSVPTLECRGAEVHNPNVDPRSGNVCLGVWKHDSHGTFKLAHRVWSYDSNGNFMGTIHLSETVTLRDGGNNAHRFLYLGFLRPFRQLSIRGSRQCHGRTHFGGVIRGMVHVRGEPQLRLFPVASGRRCQERSTHHLSREYSSGA